LCFTLDLTVYASSPRRDASGCINICTLRSINLMLNVCEHVTFIKASYDLSQLYYIDFSSAGQLCMA
jgi:hypothetical protein